jgi:hypothetical protein
MLRKTKICERYEINSRPSVVRQYSNRLESNECCTNAILSYRFIRKYVDKK